MSIKASVHWHYELRPQEVIEVREYRAPDDLYPNGAVLIVGWGRCPLWADRGQIAVHPKGGSA